MVDRETVSIEIWKTSTYEHEFKKSNSYGKGTYVEYQMCS